MKIVWYTFTQIISDKMVRKTLICLWEMCKISEKIKCKAIGKADREKNFVWFFNLLVEHSIKFFLGNRLNSSVSN